MIKNGNSLILIISIAFIIILTAAYYVFNVYETVVESSGNVLYSGSSSQITITAFPVNALGFKVPFRKIKSSFRVIEGSGLIEIIKKDETGGQMIIRAGSGTGRVIIYVKPVYSLLPTMIEINVLPNAA